MGATWFHNFIARILLWVPPQALMMVNRLMKNDELNFTQAIILTVFGQTLVEFSIYLNMKAKAQLFIKGKTTKQQ